MKNKNPSVALPTVISQDEIALFSDEKLADEISNLVSQRMKVIKEKADAYPWEVELCYLRREAQIRRKRRKIAEELAQGVE